MKTQTKYFITIPYTKQLVQQKDTSNVSYREGSFDAIWHYN